MGKLQTYQKFRHLKYQIKDKIMFMRKIMRMLNLYPNTKNFEPEPEWLIVSLGLRIGFAIGAIY